jgi:hypothetical protein
VTSETLERALPIANAIGLAGRTRGFTLVDNKQKGRLALIGHNASVQFRITEQLDTQVGPSRWQKGQTENYKLHIAKEISESKVKDWRLKSVHSKRGFVRKTITRQQRSVEGVKLYLPKPPVEGGAENSRLRGAHSRGRRRSQRIRYSG